MTEAASRILIIDGDARSLQLMETLFKAEGYVTETATNGEDALHAGGMDDHEKPHHLWR